MQVMFPWDHGAVFDGNMVGFQDPNSKLGVDPGHSVKP